MARDGKALGQTGAGRALRLLLDNIPYIVLLALVLWNCVFTKNFFSATALWNAMFQCASTVVVSMGMTLVIATGGIDLSTGSMVAGAGMLATLVMRSGSIALGVAAALAFSLAGGFINGIFAGKFKVQPMIVTLGTMYIFRGIARLASGGSNTSTRAPAFNDLTYIKIGGAPIQLFLFLAVAAAVGFLVNKTAFGQKIFACGDNARASEMAGIRVWTVILGVYMIASLLAGVAALMEVSMATGADPNNLGLGMELDAIAAVAVGGTPMSGGRPRVMGTLAGVFILQIITMMINMNNVPYAYSLAITAGILILALLLQRLRRSHS